MMIPDKIYLQYYGSDTLDPEDYDADIDNADVSWCIDRIFDSDIEYIRAPIAKRFDVEKPLKSGNYLISNHIPEPVWHWIDYYHADTNEWDTGSPYWFAEIILPTIPEGV